MLPILQREEHCTGQSGTHTFGKDQAQPQECDDCTLNQEDAVLCRGGQEGGEMLEYDRPAGISLTHAQQSP